MPYVTCPVCKDDEKTIHLELEGGYEPDTGAGPYPEVKEVECGCELSADDFDAVYAEADKLDADSWVYDPD
jgi:hypothetical protein